MPFSIGEGNYQMFNKLLQSIELLKEYILEVNLLDGDPVIIYLSNSNQ
jgi:hypothetical protein